MDFISDTEGVLAEITASLRMKVVIWYLRSSEGSERDRSLTLLQNRGGRSIRRLHLVSVHFQRVWRGGAMA